MTMIAAAIQPKNPGKRRSEEGQSKGNTLDAQKTESTSSRVAPAPLPIGLVWKKNSLAFI